MKDKIKLLSILVFLFINNLLKTQISQEGIPLSFEANIETINGGSLTHYENIAKIVMPTVSQEAIDSIIQGNEDSNRNQFAYQFTLNTDLKSVSTKDSLGFGVIYRVIYKSENAYSINFLFNQYHIPHGAMLFMYNIDTSHMIGAFTSNNNNQDTFLAFQPIIGSEIVIEYFEPYWADFVGLLNIESLNHDFLGILGSKSPSSLPCQVDVNCSEGNLWQNQKQSVVMYILKGKEVCSGALINNSNIDGRPLILTAAHCFQRPQDWDKNAKDLVFIFNFERPYCGYGKANQNHSISGAKVISTADNTTSSYYTDFILLEMNKKPPHSFNAYYAGWDRNSTQGAGGVGISHPQGDVKKIATYDMIPNDPACNDNELISYFGVKFLETTNGHSLTERISSGSPLFNNQGRIIGQLWGGCSGSTTCETAGDKESQYGKFYLSWNLDENISDARLRDWLNPENNIFILDGNNTCPNGIADNHVLNHTITGLEEWRANNTIVTSNKIEPGAHVLYEAGQEINFEPEFEAKIGSTFEAKNSNCIFTCNAINVPFWIDFVAQGSTLCYNIHNADSYEVTILTMGGTVVHQELGTISSNNICFWNTSGHAKGTYTLKIVFHSNCEIVSKTIPIQVL